MARTKISEFSATPGDNTDIDGIDIAEGCAPSGINNAIRELMAQLKDMQTGASGDTFTLTTVNSTTMDTTNLEVTNLKAKDGTSAGSIANSTGVVTLASTVLTTTDINGGTVDGTVIGGSSAAAGTFTSLTDSGNLAFTGTGNRVTGDLSNSTVASRVAIQTNTTNGATLVTAIPNGTSQVSRYQAFNTPSDLANTGFAGFGINSTEVQMIAGTLGTGTALPMTFYTNGSERVKIETSGRVVVAKSSVGTTTALTSSSASIAVDMSAANNFTHTFTENTTLANPTNLTAGQSGIIVFTQHASSPKTLAFGSYWDFPGGTVPTVTASNSAVDVLAYYVNSSTSITAKLLGDVK